MFNSILVALVLAGTVVGAFYFRWLTSNWRNEQVVAIELLDRLIARVITLADRPDSGLSTADIGDLGGDWQTVRTELSAQCGFGAWLKSGRLNHAIEDPYARALSNFAARRADPLHAALHSHSTGRLKPYLISEIFEVLSVNIDELAERNSNIVQLVPVGHPELA